MMMAMWEFGKAKNKQSAITQPWKPSSSAYTSTLNLIWPFTVPDDGSTSGGDETGLPWLLLPPSKFDDSLLTLFVMLLYESMLPVVTFKLSVHVKNQKQQQHTQLSQ